MPVTALTEKALPELLEFFDFRARRGERLQLLGQADDSREALAATPDSAFAARSMLGVKSGQANVIRGVAQFQSTSAGGADVGFLMDESIDSQALVSDVLARLIDGARASGVTLLDVTAPEPSTLFNALRASGCPMQDGEVAGHYLVTILEPGPAF